MTKQTQTPEKPDINGPVIEGLRQISRDIVNEANFRVAAFNTREERGRSIITPTPAIEEKTGYFDWFYHILDRQQDLEEQLKYLNYLAEDIAYRIKEIETIGDKILYSGDAQERIIKFYVDSAQEMGVLNISEDLIKEWLPEEWKARKEADALNEAEDRKIGKE
jgi:hypothetical protein